jgi:glutamate racemase
MMMTRQNKTEGPIGVFDSGVGGLSVLREIRRQLPKENLIYIADQAHVPYGNRSREEVFSFSAAIVRFLIQKQAKLVVIACNTASAVALAELRGEYPSLPFVGMEPAVKLAAAETSTGVVGVLATPATFQGDLYASTVERFAKGVKILQNTCPGLVNQIEAGQITSYETRQILERALHPMLAEGVDEIVMGCTHYPFVIPLIQEIVGDGVEVIDPAPAVARQTGRLLDEYDLHTSSEKEGEVIFYTSGNAPSLDRIINDLLKLETSSKGVYWQGSDLKERQP